jgi:hypothetical protein
MTMTSQSLNAAILVPGLSKVYFNEYNQWPEEFRQFLNVEGSKRSFEERMLVAALGLTQVKPEGFGITYEDLLDRPPIRMTHVARALGYRCTREAKDDDMYNVIADGARALARSVRQTKELIGAAPLNNAFNAAFTGLDGVSLCNTAHPLLGGGTFSNMLSATLSPTSLRALLIAAEKAVDDKGLNVMIPMRHLVVPVDLRYRAMQILGSPLEPFKADNEINPLRELGLKAMTLHFLTSAVACFLLADKSQHALQYYERVKPEFEGADDFDTGDSKFKTYHRDSSGFWHHWGVFGLDGTGS